MTRDRESTALHPSRLIEKLEVEYINTALSLKLPPASPLVKPCPAVNTTVRLSRNPAPPTTIRSVATTNITGSSSTKRSHNLSNNRRWYMSSSRHLRKTTIAVAGAVDASLGA
ncbi:hypothetical protein Hypma_012355 [Hypsizygus marmoreus]|uniref:Uncharacterized protein n=1 Tax=Hypsizygus marmoreus TaxID=39966 RepID=A0A369KEI8_HYPMA|nr:hypothetical protein Hypma_012355 [Hypsizygus marmoreus]